MTKFIADLHIHSRFSRATSKSLNLPLLDAWAGLKGIDVLGTGDFTHPQWREEIRKHTEQEESSGLYLLKEEYRLGEVLPGLFAKKNQADFINTSEADGKVRFMLQGEISSVYKRGGRTRRVHNLVFMPNLDAADSFCARLEAIGNLKSDGRPILGLDSRDLLEIVLETHPQAFLVPAHIWTPWYSIFGSKSGFDSIEECFGDLSSHIFALETGLSSDPPMNRLLSSLDAYRLISNSDAHSGENLAREANIFSGKISYSSIFKALKEPQKDEGTKFLGTFEFFPEQGKYHADGHRKCKINFSPEESRAVKGICPVCHKALTLGVNYRVMELADRKEPLHPDQIFFKTLIPLRDILGEIYNQGAKTKKVSNKYIKALNFFGSELAILNSVPLDDLDSFFTPLGEAVKRMRKGKVKVNSGFDGEFGQIKIFSSKEQEEIKKNLN